MWKQLPKHATSSYQQTTTLIAIKYFCKANELPLMPEITLILHPDIIRCICEAVTGVGFSTWLVTYY